MARRGFLSQLFSLPVAAQPGAGAKPPRKKVLIKSAWGSDDPTKAGFAFFHAAALVEAGHTVQIFLLGEGVVVMRKAVADAILPVGWPPLAEGLAKVVAHGVPIHV